MSNRSKLLTVLALVALVGAGTINLAEAHVPHSAKATFNQYDPMFRNKNVRFQGYHRKAFQDYISQNVQRCDGNRQAGYMPRYSAYGYNQYNQLPPGILKNLRRGQSLPPGLARQVQFLPYQSNAYFGLPANNYRLGLLGSDVLLYNQSNGTIQDILRNIF